MDFENSLAEPAEGDVVSGVIVHKDKDGALLVDIGAKSEGLVRPGEVSRTGLAEEEEEPKVGDTIKVVVIGRDKEDGKLLLSKKRADFERAWDRVEESLTDQRIIHAMVTERVKGGLVVDLGIRGFVPASHVGTGDFKHTNLDKYVGQSIPLKVIEVDREKRKVILSNKDATREERSKRRTDTLASLKEGQVREGIVRRVTDYGAFVDLGGIDGLLHVSEMSWARINHPSDVVKVGDTINVMILKMRPDQDRISLGLRQILPDPWTDVPGKYHVGDRLKVQVSRLVPFGAFVTLDGGIEAIIPNSELSQRRVSRPQDVINAGDEVDALIIELKPDERKMTLSVRRIAEQERRDQDAAAREQEYQDFRAMSSEGSARPGRDRKRRGDTPDYSQSGRVTLGDVFGEQFARARKEVSRKGRKADSQDYDEAEPDIDAEVESVVEAETVAEPTTESAAAVEVEVQAVAEEPATESTEE
jgi:4-hydroxy-3-methylbut-2-enyl diphosphate reductase